MKSYLNFVEQPNEGRKTKRFHVYSATQPGSVLLGVVGFRPTWRTYVYESGNSVYDVNCLTEIAGFVKALNDARKEALAKEAS